MGEPLTPQKAHHSKEEKPIGLNKKGDIKHMVGQDKDTTLEECTSKDLTCHSSEMCTGRCDSPLMLLQLVAGLVESGTQISNDYFISSSRNELSHSGEEWLQENVIHVIHTKGRKAKFHAIINNKQSAIALFDTEATCSCINYETFQSIMNSSEWKMKKITVVQADG